MAALAALAWRTPWEGGPPIKRLKTDEVPKTPENGPRPGSRFDYTPKYLSCVRKWALAWRTPWEGDLRKRAVAALAALAWRTPWEGGPPIKRLKTDEVPKTPENGPKPGSRFDYTPKYLSCVRKCLRRPSETGRRWRHWRHWRGGPPGRGTLQWSVSKPTRSRKRPETGPNRAPVLTTPQSTFPV